MLNAVQKHIISLQSLLTTEFVITYKMEVVLFSGLYLLES